MKNHKLSAIIQTFKTKNAKRETIRLVVGELIGDEESLRHEWIGLTSATPLANVKLNIHIVPAEQQCMWCFLVYHPAKGETKCPQCGSVGAKILSGEEFYLEED